MANFNFKPQVNPTTGEQYFEAQFQSKLVAVNPDNVLENSNGTSYILGTIQYENAKGQPQESSAQIYLANYMDKEGNTRMEVGKTYLTTVRVTPGDPRPPLVFVSHLTSAPRATEDDFGFSLENVQVDAAKANLFNAVEK